jgi:hypothetical protein
LLKCIKGPVTNYLPTKCIKLSEYEVESLAGRYRSDVDPRLFFWLVPYSPLGGRGTRQVVSIRHHPT